MFFKKKKTDAAPEPAEDEYEEDDDAVDEELYRRGDLISFTVGNDKSLVYSRTNRKASIHPTFAVSLLPAACADRKVHSSSSDLYELE